MLAQRLLGESIRVGIASSGYGRIDRQASFVAPGHKVQNMPVTETGDETRHLSELLPEALFAVDRLKWKAAEQLALTGLVDIILVDDGFQHRALNRDLDIVTFDSALLPRHLRIFPFGVLREPLKALERAQIVVFTRTRLGRHHGRYQRLVAKLNPTTEQYQAQLVPDELVGRDRRLPLKYIEDKSAFLFAGVGNFRQLRRQVEALCADLDAAVELSDHQRYDPATLNRLRRRADRLGSDVILTTGKDWVKLADFDFGREIYYLSQTVDLDPGEEKLIQSIKERLNLTGRAI
jgi:tetraacyldisaccharide 4'-kinase